MDNQARRAAQRRTAREIKAGRSPLGGEYKRITERQLERGPVYHKLERAIQEAKAAGGGSFIVAKGTPRDKKKYKAVSRWLSINETTSPWSYDWARRGLQQRSEELFSEEPTSFKVVVIKHG